VPYLEADFKLVVFWRPRLLSGLQLQRGQKHILKPANKRPAIYTSKYSQTCQQEASNIYEYVFSNLPTRGQQYIRVRILKPANKRPAIYTSTYSQNSQQEASNIYEYVFSNLPTRSQQYIRVFSKQPGINTAIWTDDKNSVPRRYGIICMVLSISWLASRPIRLEA
jgi:hypothetical protein